MPIVTKEIISGMLESIHEGLWCRQIQITGARQDSNGSKRICKNISPFCISTIPEPLVDAIGHAQDEMFAVIPNFN